MFGHTAVCAQYKSSEEEQKGWLWGWRCARSGATREAGMHASSTKSIVKYNKITCNINGFYKHHNKNKGPPIS